MGMNLGFLAVLLMLLPDGGKDNRNLMLNAESASAPREINVGLPGGGSPLISMDGFVHAHGIADGPHHWPGANANEALGSIGLM